MKKEIIEKISSLVIAAFGLVAALAWNSAIQAIFQEYFGTAEGIIPMLVYAVAVTIVAVLITIWVAKIADKRE
jgi:membrane protein YdbS with pleckstrin-like domain